MGKKQHSKDRMFMTATEWKETGGGKKTATSRSYRPLAFDSCALSLAPYETPVCTPEGVLFDILNLFPYVQKHKKNPITGQTMTPKEIVRLNMYKNAEGNWHCPVTFKEFNNHTHVVAVRTSGNVYTWDAIEELNIKQKNWTDLMTGEAFTRKDIITLQDPSNTEHMALRDISNFKHLQEVREEEAAKFNADQASNIRTNASTEVVIKEFQRQKREREEEEALKAAAAEAKEVEEGIGGGGKKAKILLEDLHPGKVVTTGKAAASFTATGMDLATANACREATAEEIREVRWKFARKLGKKGYVQLQTTLGNLNIEIHCDFVPRTAENFIGLCLKGFYDGLKFHRKFHCLCLKGFYEGLKFYRVIKGFMVQGGCPKGNGTGGETIWGKEAFKDEFDSRLLHDKRGILSMANSGRDTNRSQFFITFKATRHLDNQHTVFGRVVGGMETLARIEAVDTDKNDVPEQEIKIIKAVAFVNPFDESNKQFDDFVADRRAQRETAVAFKKDNNALGFTRTPGASRSAEEEEAANRKGFYSQPGPTAKRGSGVGKYFGDAKAGTTLPNVTDKSGPAVAPSAPLETAKKPVAGKTVFKDFSGW